MWFDETEIQGIEAGKRVDTFYERWRKSGVLMVLTIGFVVFLLGVLMVSRMILGAHSLD